MGNCYSLIPYPPLRRYHANAWGKRLPTIREKKTRWGCRWPKKCLRSEPSNDKRWFGICCEHHCCEHHCCEHHCCEHHCCEHHCCEHHCCEHHCTQSPLGVY